MSVDDKVTKTVETNDIIVTVTEFEDLEDEPGSCMRCVASLHEKTASFYSNRKRTIQLVAYLVVFMIYLGYFGYAMYVERLNNLESITLLWVTSLGIFLYMYSVVSDKYGGKVREGCWAPIESHIKAHWKLLKWIFCVLVVASFTAIVGIVVARTSPYNLVSLGGAFVLLSLSFIFSTKPGMINWRIVLWGLGLQFTFALVVLRTNAGYQTFRWLSNLILTVVDFVQAGILFVFGEAYENHFFAMGLMPIVVYLCSVIAVLYSCGVIQVVVKKFGWMMENLVGTTAGESTAAAANVFLGMFESPMLIAPMLKKMTDSEIHCTMTSGFSTIEVGTMAAFMFMGIPASHILSAAVISAPCALAVSKIFMPETKKSKFKGVEIEFEKRNYRNVFDAACKGAIEGVIIVGSMLGNLIAFLSILALANGLLTWMGNRVGITDPPLTFELICSYLLWPAAFCLGVVVEDCSSVAELLGIKMFINEFVAYIQLVSLIENGEKFREHAINNGSYLREGRDLILYGSEQNVTTILIGGILQRRTEVICTYALCGFANFGSIGMMLGLMSTLVPSRMSSISSLMLRAMIAATITSYLTACTAGLLYDPELDNIK